MDSASLISKIHACASLEALEDIRGQLLGKKGALSMALKDLAHMSPEERKIQGPRLNAIKVEVQEAIAARQQELEAERWAHQLQNEAIDVSLTGETLRLGKFHPLMQTMAQAIEIFSAMGFQVRRGPDIETPFYNFDALNVGADHPARAAQDTFYLGEHVLRTQTSPVQIRTMMTEPLPLRIVAPGRVYRADHDRTHTPMFHQLEGLVVEEGIHMGHLKGCLQAFFQHFLERTVELRFRPSFFPFTEPSAEVDLAFEVPGRPKQWLEVLGCGMVHPQVFINCGLSPHHQGFAFGMGLERLAMIKYGIEDIRLLYLHDQRWLDHYGTWGAEPGL